MTTILPYETHLFAQLERAANKFSLKEEKQDTVTLDVPLLIRLLELAREDIKDDVTLHKVVERMLAVRDRGVLTMDAYEFIAGKVEQRVAAPKQDPDVADIRKLAGL